MSAIIKIWHGWRAWLLDEDDAAVRMLRERTRTGRPRGPAEFVERLAKLLGRPLAPKKRGRKPKRKKRKADGSAPSPNLPDEVDK